MDSTTAAEAPPVTQEPAINDVFKAIDDIPSDGAPPPARQQERAPAPAKPVAKEAPPKPAAKPPAKPTPKFDDDLEGLRKPVAEEPPAPTPEPEKEFKTPKELREAYDGLKTWRTDAEKKIADLEEGVRSAEARGAEKTAKDLQAKLDAITKSHQEMETELRYLDYTKTAEYRTKWTDPIKATWKSVQDEIAGIKIDMGDGRARDATTDDIYALVTMAPADARREAKEAFGEDASSVLQHVVKLRELYAGKRGAETEWREKGSVWEKQQREAAEQHHAKTRETFTAGVKRYQSEFPDFFGADPADAEAKGYLDSGNKLARLAMLQEGLPEGMSAEEKHAKILDAQTKLAARGAAYPVLRLKLNRAEETIAKLQAELAEFKKSEPVPDADAEAGQNGHTRFKSAADEIDAAVDAIPAR